MSHLKRDSVTAQFEVSTDALTSLGKLEATKWAQQHPKVCQLEAWGLKVVFLPHSLVLQTNLVTLIEIPAPLVLVNLHCRGPAMEQQRHLQT